MDAPLSTHCRWYVDLWDEFSKGKSGDKKDVQEIDEVMDMADDKSNDKSNDNSNDQTCDYNYTNGQYLNYWWHK